MASPKHGAPPPVETTHRPLCNDFSSTLRSHFLNTSSPYFENKIGMDVRYLSSMARSRSTNGTPSNCATFAPTTLFPAPEKPTMVIISDIYMTFSIAFTRLSAQAAMSEMRAGNI